MSFPISDAILFGSDKDEEESRHNHPHHHRSGGDPFDLKRGAAVGPSPSALPPPSSAAELRTRLEEVMRSIDATLGTTTTALNSNSSGAVAACPPPALAARSRDVDDLVDSILNDSAGDALGSSYGYGYGAYPRRAPFTKLLEDPVVAYGRRREALVDLSSLLSNTSADGLSRPPPLPTAAGTHGPAFSSVAMPFSSFSSPPPPPSFLGADHRSRAAAAAREDAVRPLFDQPPPRPSLETSRADGGVRSPKRPPAEWERRRRRLEHHEAESDRLMAVLERRKRDDVEAMLAGRAADDESLLPSRPLLLSGPTARAIESSRRETSPPPSPSPTPATVMAIAVRPTLAHTALQESLRSSRDGSPGEYSLPPPRPLTRDRSPHGQRGWVTRLPAAAASDEDSRPDGSQGSRPTRPAPRLQLRAASPAAPQQRGRQSPISISSGTASQDGWPPQQSSGLSPAMAHAIQAELRRLGIRPRDIDHLVDAVSRPSSRPVSITSGGGAAAASNVDMTDGSDLAIPDLAPASLEAARVGSSKSDKHKQPSGPTEFPWVSAPPVPESREGTPEQYYRPPSLTGGGNRRYHGNQQQQGQGYYQLPSEEHLDGTQRPDSNAVDSPHTAAAAVLGEDGHYYHCPHEYQPADEAADVVVEQDEDFDPTEHTAPPALEEHAYPPPQQRQQQYETGGEDDAYHRQEEGGLAGAAGDDGHYYYYYHYKEGEDGGAQYQYGGEEEEKGEGEGDASGGVAGWVAQDHSHDHQEEQHHRHRGESRPSRKTPRVPPLTAAVDDDDSPLSAPKDPEYDMLPSPTDSPAGRGGSGSGSPRMSPERFASIRSERLHVSPTRRLKGHDTSDASWRRKLHATTAGPHSTVFDSAVASSSSSTSSSASSCPSVPANGHHGAAERRLDAELRDVFHSTRAAPSVFGWPPAKTNKGKALVSRGGVGGGDGAAGTTTPLRSPRRPLRTESVSPQRRPRWVRGSSSSRGHGDNDGDASPGRALNAALAETTMVQALRIMQSGGVPVEVRLLGRQIPAHVKLSTDGKELLILIESLQQGASGGCGGVSPAASPAPRRSGGPPPGFVKVPRSVSAPPTPRSGRYSTGAAFASTSPTPTYSRSISMVSNGAASGRYVPVKAGNNQVMWLDMASPRFSGGSAMMQQIQREVYSGSGSGWSPGGGSTLTRSPPRRHPDLNATAPPVSHSAPPPAGRYGLPSMHMMRSPPRTAPTAAHLRPPPPAAATAPAEAALAQSPPLYPQHQHQHQQTYPQVFRPPNAGGLVAAKRPPGGVLAKGPPPSGAVKQQQQQRQVPVPGPRPEQSWPVQPAPVQRQQRIPSPQDQRAAQSQQPQQQQRPTSPQSRPLLQQPPRQPWPVPAPGSRPVSPQPPPQQRQQPWPAQPQPQPPQPQRLPQSVHHHQQQQQTQSRPLQPQPQPLPVQQRRPPPASGAIPLTPEMRQRLGLPSAAESPPLQRTPIPQPQQQQQRRAPNAAFRPTSAPPAFMRRPSPGPAAAVVLPQYSQQQQQLPPSPPPPPRQQYYQSLRPPFTSPPPAIRGPSIDRIAGQAVPAAHRRRRSTSTTPTRSPGGGGGGFSFGSAFRPEALIFAAEMNRSVEDSSNSMATAGGGGGGGSTRLRELHHFPVRHARTFFPRGVIGYESERTPSDCGPGSWEDVAGVLCGPAAFEVLRRHRCPLFAHAAGPDYHPYRLYYIVPKYKRLDSPRDAVLLVLDFRIRKDFITFLIAAQAAGPGEVLSYGRALWMLAAQRIQRARALSGLNPFAMAEHFGTGGGNDKRRVSFSAVSRHDPGGQQHEEDKLPGKMSLFRRLSLSPQRGGGASASRPRAADPSDAAELFGDSVRRGGATRASRPTANGLLPSPHREPPGYVRRAHSGVTVTTAPLGLQTLTPPPDPPRRWPAAADPDAPVSPVQAPGPDDGEEDRDSRAGSSKRFGIWTKLTHLRRSSPRKTTAHDDDDDGGDGDAAEVTHHRKQSRFRLPSFSSPKPASSGKS